MEVDGEVRSAGGVRPSEAVVSAFATDLESVIDQLEMDFMRNRLRRETASRIRELRERAGQLFGDSG